MAVNPKQAAKRAFVTILLALATTYGLLLQITRDSDDAAVLKTFLDGNLSNALPA